MRNYTESYKKNIWEIKENQRTPACISNKKKYKYKRIMIL